MTNKKNFDAYYYCLDSTGVDVVDDILRALASAGKGYPHTEDWNHAEDDGGSEIKKIQNRSNLAASYINKLLDKIEKDRELLVELSFPELSSDELMVIGYYSPDGAHRRYSREAAQLALNIRKHLEENS